MTAILKTGKNVAIHCRQGIGRSGLLAAASLMTSGIGAREAGDAVTKARGVTVPETPGQMQWLNQLATRDVALAS
jgi:protein-tyrosine phosphatase